MYFVTTERLLKFIHDNKLENKCFRNVWGRLYWDVRLNDDEHGCIQYVFDCKSGDSAIGYEYDRFLMHKEISTKEALKLRGE